MTYKHSMPPRRRQPRVAQAAVALSPEGPLLSGMVKGKKASDLEEVFARALDKTDSVQWWQFRNHYGAPMGQVGSIELDFLVYTGTSYPVQIDGDWIHRSAEAKAHDLLQDARLNAILQPRGAMPVERIPGYKLQDGREASQDKADRIVEEMFV